MTLRQRAPVRLAMIPGCEGNYELGLRDVPDPYELGKTVLAAANVKATCLLWWHSRSLIDDAQYLAGTRYQAIYYAAEVGGPSAIRYDRPMVDGGYPLDPINQKAIKARKQLVELSKVLGAITSRLMSHVLGEGVTIEREAQRWPGSRAESFVGRRIRHGLTLLAGHWGT